MNGVLKVYHYSVHCNLSYASKNINYDFDLLLVLIINNNQL